MDKPINFSLIGRSGSGKGTQAKLLLELYPNTEYIYTGDLFRELAKQDTDVGHKIAAVLKEGGLPFDDLATTLWMYKIAFKVQPGEGIMFDGTPRRLGEAHNLDRFLSYLGRLDMTAFLLIDISREEAFSRLMNRRICKQCNRIVPHVGEFKEWIKCGDCGGELVPRPDDNPEAINHRLDYFDKEVLPVIKHYEDEGLLIKIDGAQDIEDVFSSIKKELSIRFTR